MTTGRINQIATEFTRNARRGCDKRRRFGCAARGGLLAWRQSSSSAGSFAITAVCELTNGDRSRRRFSSLSANPTWTNLEGKPRLLERQRTPCCRPTDGFFYIDTLASSRVRGTQHRTMQAGINALFDTDSAPLSITRLRKQLRLACAGFRRASIFGDAAQEASSLPGQNPGRHCAVWNAAKAPRQGEGVVALSHHPPSSFHPNHLSTLDRVLRTPGTGSPYPEG